MGLQRALNLQPRCARRVGHGFLFVTRHVLTNGHACLLRLLLSPAPAVLPCVLLPGRAPTVCQVALWALRVLTPGRSLPATCFDDVTFCPHPPSSAHLMALLAPQNAQQDRVPPSTRPCKRDMLLGIHNSVDLP